MENWSIERSVESLPERTLIIGYGNTLREDDGFGVYVARRLAKKFKAIAVRQLTPELVEAMADFDLIIFIDANIENTPGTLAVPLASVNEPFNHSLSPRKIIALADLIYGKKTNFLIFSAGAGSLSYKEKLTPPLKKAAKTLLGFLFARLVQNR
ncbi:MAG: hydrogenase maturation protease [Helicobacteraceae bacterium]|nr:hydrogenase maturation protease [Helicobacteraceae bacterium]